MDLSAFQKISKTILIIVLLLASLAIAIFGGNQVSKYFAKASTSPIVKTSASSTTSNSAVLTWETSEDKYGGVLQYGTKVGEYGILVNETTFGKTHNVPLTILTPNTTYYYVINIGNVLWDSSGKNCEKSEYEAKTCLLTVPWSFTTMGITPQPAIVASLPSPSPAIVLATPTHIPATTSATPKVTVVPTVKKSALLVTPTGTLSVFCKKVQTYIGEASGSAQWASVKQYDIDNNSRINGVDIIKCIASGK